MVWLDIGVVLSFWLASKDKEPSFTVVALFQRTVRCKFQFELRGER
jgi:hypothetical protein